MRSIKPTKSDQQTPSLAASSRLGLSPWASPRWDDRAKPEDQEEGAECVRSVHALVLPAVLPAIKRYKTIYNYIKNIKPRGFLASLKLFASFFRPTRWWDRA